MRGGQRRREAGPKFYFNRGIFDGWLSQPIELIYLVFLGKISHLVPERQLKKLVFGLQLGDEVVDDDEVEGEEGAAADVDDLEAGEGEEGQLVHLGGRELQPQQKDNEKNLGLIGAAHEEHLLLQTYKL